MINAKGMPARMKQMTRRAANKRALAATLVSICSASLVCIAAGASRAEEEKVYLLCDGTRSNPSQGTPSVAFSEVDVIDFKNGVFYEAAHPNEEDWQRLTSISDDEVAWSSRGAIFPANGQWVQFTKSGSVNRKTGIGKTETLDSEQRVMELKTFKCISGKARF
ncbi:MAG: hypothetical protein NVSMB26_26990 [Beijerinckiaceae bacterium]